MSDIIDILGIDKEAVGQTASVKAKKEAKKDPYASLPRYLRELVDDSNPPPDFVFEEKKKIVISKDPAQKWENKEFTSSARTDGVKFRHWVRRNVEYPDYPFSRFNVKINVITYTIEEYEDCVFDIPSNWTIDHSDELFSLCRQYDLRWPVIMDQFSAKHYSVEDCQTVFLEVTTAVLDRRYRLGHKLSEEEEGYMKYKFDIENSFKRRKQQDILFKSQSVSQQEEKQLQSTLKSLQDTLNLIGSPDNRRSYGGRVNPTVMKQTIEQVLNEEKVILRRPGVYLSSTCFKEEFDMGKDLREEYRHVLEELHLTDLRNLSYSAHMKLILLKKRIIILLMAIKCRADYGLIPLPNKQVRRWTTAQSKDVVRVGKKKSKK